MNRFLVPATFIWLIFRRSEACRAADALVVLQNDKGNQASPNVVVVPLTSTIKRSPLGLKRSLDIAIPVKSDVDHVLRAYMWLGYMGFLEDEAIAVRADEINIRRMQIDHGDNRRPIYVEALDDILSSAEMDRFSSARGYAMRADGECILRGAEGNRNIDTAMWIRPVVSSRFRTAARLNPEIEIVLHLSYKRVLLSGICYRAYELERIGESPYTLLEEAAQRDYRATSEGKGFALDTKHTENFFSKQNFERLQGRLYPLEIYIYNMTCGAVDCSQPNGQWKKETSCCRIKTTTGGFSMTRRYTKVEGLAEVVRTRHEQGETYAKIATSYGSEKKLSRQSYV